MARFALICPPFIGHIRVFEALAGELAARGHDAFLLLNAGADRFARPGTPVFCARRGASGDLDRVIRRAARPNGPLGVLRTVADTAGLTDALCEDGPGSLRRTGANAVIADQMEPAGGLLAAHLGLPFASIAAALPFNAAPGVPLPFLAWRFDPSPAGLKRNRGGEKVASLLLARQRRTIEAWSARFELARRSSLEDCFSPLLQIAQTVPGFDFPRPASPIYHAVGPIRRACATREILPFAVDPEKPFVFASLGTLQGHRFDVFRKIAAACRAVGAQVLVAHCGRLSDAAVDAVGADFSTDFAPQAAALARADLCVTHGGMNTVMDALQAGVPLLAIPIAFEQPGIAARIVYRGVGERLNRVTLSSAKIEASLRRLLVSSAARNKAAEIGREIAASGGAKLAVDLIERALGGAGQREPRLARI